MGCSQNINSFKYRVRLVYWSLLCYTDGCKKTTKREFRGMMPYEEKCFNIVDSCSCNSWIFSEASVE